MSLETNSEQSDSLPISHRLRPNALGFAGVLLLCVAAIAPAASMLFNVPVMASQAGAATPLAFVLAAVGILLLLVPVRYFATRISSAGGIYPWVRQGLGPMAAFQAGWLLLLPMRSLKQDSMLLLRDHLSCCSRLTESICQEDG